MSGTDENRFFVKYKRINGKVIDVDRRTGIATVKTQYGVKKKVHVATLVGGKRRWPEVGDKIRLSLADGKPVSGRIL